MWVCVWNLTKWEVASHSKRWSTVLSMWMCTHYTQLLTGRYLTDVHRSHGRPKSIDMLINNNYEPQNVRAGFNSSAGSVKTVIQCLIREAERRSYDRMWFCRHGYQSCLSTLWFQWRNPKSLFQFMKQTIPRVLTPFLSSVGDTWTGILIRSVRSFCMKQNGTTAVI